MIVSISQPTLFPWLGYFNIIKNSDIFVFLDNVKFEKRSWQMRNRLKATVNTDKSEEWVRIPTQLKKSDTLIKDVIIDNTQDWKAHHITSFRTHYGKAYENLNFLRNIYEQEWTKLSDFNIKFITDCCNFLEINTEFMMASQLPVSGKKGQLMLNICDHLSTTEYLTTVGSRNYLENYASQFVKSNIKISYHGFQHPIYKQKGGEFLPNMSILDLLFNEQENSKHFV
tara:strand:+ start:125 stop:805 length:681 start_codon:yes stop_codon:yes gene_type:complete